MQRNWLLTILMAVGATAQAQGCFTTMVLAPSPLMGNHGEIFRTSNGGIYEVVGSFEYLYAYFPQVTICPGVGRMVVNGKAVGIQQLQPSSQSAPAPIDRRRSDPRQDRPSASTPPITVLLRVRGCDYFIADGPLGYYLLEWYGGYDPDRGDGIYGELYNSGQQGRLYIDDYSLSRDSALEKLRAKCR